tara:strand:- start:64 stop:855 length:792 start_codon:yes stop_codon:yes gene_type:complete
MNYLQVREGISPPTRNTIEEKKVAATKIQSFARGYLTRKNLPKLWVKNQLNTLNLTANDLLFKIVKNETSVPPKLSLHLVLDSLIAYGADVNMKDKNEGIYFLETYCNHIIYVLTLGYSLDNYTDLNKFGGTPIHYAAKNGHIEIAKALIQKGADVNTKDFLKGTPHHWAIKNNNLEMAKLLVENGADVHTNSDNEEYTFKDKIETFGAFTFTAVAAIMVTNNDNEEFTLFSSDSISSKIQRTVVALTIIAAAVGTIMVATRK